MSSKTVRGRTVVACALLATLLAGCGAHGISGEYVGKSPREVDLLQITQAGPYDIHGSISATDYTNGYHLEHDTAAFTGSVNDGQIALNFGLGQLSGTVAGGTITLPASNLVLKRSSKAAYNKIVAHMTAQAPKLAAQKAAKAKRDAAKQAAKEKREAVQAAQNRAILSEADSLSNFIYDPTSAVRHDVKRERLSVREAHNYVSGGDYYIPERIPNAAAAKDYYRSTFKKSQTKLAADIAKLEKSLGGWDTKIAASPCIHRASEYSFCKNELGAAAKYALVSKQAKADIAQAEQKSKQLAGKLASVLQHNRPERR